MDNSVGRLFCISSRQRSIVIGTLFGDGRLECRSKNNTARLRIHHGTNQKALVFWKYRELRNFVLKGPRKINSWRYPKDSKKYYSWYFHTRTLKEFGCLHKIFYVDGKKVLPENSEKLFTKLMLAVWYMDDGCRDKNTIILNTQNFDYTENLKLRSIFQKKYQMKTHVVKDRDKFRLYFDKNSSKMFLSLVTEGIIPSMRYKTFPVTTDPKGEAFC
jgi:hypothetical protein